MAPVTTRLYPKRQEEVHFPRSDEQTNLNLSSVPWKPSHYFHDKRLALMAYFDLRCGCLQVGDRIVSLNHQPNLTLQEINSILELGNDPSGSGKIVLQVEFDVADTIVPSSGVFTIKLAKRGPGLGITITGRTKHFYTRTERRKYRVTDFPLFEGICLIGLFTKI